MGDEYFYEGYQVTKETFEFLKEEKRLFINGENLVTSERASIEVEDPFTGKVIDKIIEANTDDIQFAMNAAKDGMKRWNALTPRDREQIMHKVAALIRENLQTLAEIECIDSGKAISGCRDVDINGAANTWEYFAGWATKIEGSVRKTSMPGDYFTYVEKVPVGVVAAIVPWNWPFAMATWKLAAPLAAGCSVVLKPSEMTSLSMLYFGKICKQAGVPNGVINVVTGYGKTVGETLISHPDVAKVSFTGSTPVGSNVGSIASSNISHVTLELGGKSPMIAFGDADINKLASDTLNSVFFNAGQVCSAGSRLYVEREIYRDVIEAIKTVMDTIKLGAPLDESTTMGPVISSKQKQRIIGYIEDGLSSGAKLEKGAQESSNSSLFVRPTLFSETNNQMSIVREEIFGPVLVVQAFETEEEAISLANDNEYGLAASIWTKDMSRALRVSRQVEAGSIWVNVHDPGDPSMPFGGFKQSGIGKDLGSEQLNHYLESKSVWLTI